MSTPLAAGCALADCSPSIAAPSRESNLHPLCEWCEPPKTEADVHEKSLSCRKRLRHAGIRLAPKGRPLPAMIAGGWKHRMDGGWERRKFKGAAAH
jgi:hypothetical protein